MLRLSSVHPAPPKALRRKVKGKRPSATTHSKDELRGASSTATGCAYEKDSKGKESAQRSPIEATTKENKSLNGQEEDWDDDNDSDSDYDVEAEYEEDEAGCSDGDEPEDSEEEDKDEYRRALESELDECADEGPDFYLQRMLAERAHLDDDDAAWVDRYIALQQAWKERHHYSIDAFDLDVKLQPQAEKAKFVQQKKVMVTKKKLVRRAGGPGAKKKKKAARTLYTRQLRAFWRFWYLRVFPNLPRSLQQEPAEYVLALFAVVAFLVLALAIQIHVVLRAVPSLSARN